MLRGLWGGEICQVGATAFQVLPARVLALPYLLNRPGCLVCFQIRPGDARACPVELSLAAPFNLKVLELPACGSELRNSDEASNFVIVLINDDLWLLRCNTGHDAIVDSCRLVMRRLSWHIIPT